MSHPDEPQYDMAEYEQILHRVYSFSNNPDEWMDLMEIVRTNFPHMVGRMQQLERILFDGRDPMAILRAQEAAGLRPPAGDSDSDDSGDHLPPHVPMAANRRNQNSRATGGPAENRSTPAENARAESVRTEAARAESARAEAVRAEAVRTETVKVETEKAKVAAEKVEKANAETAETMNASSSSVVTVVDASTQTPDKFSDEVSTTVTAVKPILKSVESQTDEGMLPTAMPKKLFYLVPGKHGRDEWIKAFEERKSMNTVAGLDNVIEREFQRLKSWRKTENAFPWFQPRFMQNKQRTQEMVSKKAAVAAAE